MGGLYMHCVVLWEASWKKEKQYVILYHSSHASCAPTVGWGVPVGYNQSINQSQSQSSSLALPKENYSLFGERCQQYSYLWYSSTSLVSPQKRDENVEVSGWLATVADGYLRVRPLETTRLPHPGALCAVCNPRPLLPITMQDL